MMRTTPLLIALAGFALAACERKETVFEMETPGGKVEVERDKESGAVEVQVDDK